jgi:hypothetical protein
VSLKGGTQHLLTEASKRFIHKMFSILARDPARFGCT